MEYVDTGVLSVVDENGNVHRIYPDVITDESLSLEGVPADGKAVGDAFRDTLKKIDEVASSKSVELTQAEYDALPDSKLTDNVTYYITDGEDAVSSFVLGGAS